MLPDVTSRRRNKGRLTHICVLNCEDFVTAERLGHFEQVDEPLVFISVSQFECQMIPKELNTHEMSLNRKILMSYEKDRVIT
jgi:hypothetical protein